MTKFLRENVISFTCYLFQRGFHCRVSVFVEAGPYLTGVDIRPNTLIEQWIIGTFTM